MLLTLRRALASQAADQLLIPHALFLAGIKEACLTRVGGRRSLGILRAPFPRFENCRSVLTASTMLYYVLRVSEGVQAC